MNPIIDAYNTMHGSSFKHWPSLSSDGGSSLLAATPGISNVRCWMQTDMAMLFWFYTGMVVLGPACAILACKGVWAPRQLGLAALLYVILVLCGYAQYLSQWMPVVDAFTFYPVLLVEATPFAADK